MASDDERLLTVSDGSPLHGQAKVTVGAMPVTTVANNDGHLLTVSVGERRLTAA